MANVYPDVHESLKFPVDKHVILEESLSSSRTLSSMKNLDDAYTIGDQFLNDKSTKDEPGKLNVDSKVVSMVTVLIHQASSLVSPLSTPIIDLSPPKMKSQTLDNMTQNLRSRVFTLELQDLPHMINQIVNKVCKEVVYIALQAPLRDPFKELPEADMEEILHQRMFESSSYKSLPEHVALYEAFEASMKRANRDEFLAEKDKSRKRRCDDQDPPLPPPDSDPNDVNVSNSEDTDTTHLPKIKTRPDWLKPMEECHRMLTDQVDLVNPEGHRLVLDTISFIISKLKAAHYLDFRLEELVPSLRIESERKYDISVAYNIFHWWFKRKEFYITRHDAPSDRSKVRSYIQIISVISLKTYERYGYTFLKEIVLRRADYKEYKISEADFKNLHPNDFEDLFNKIITSLKALDESFSSHNQVRKFLRALPSKWRLKVTTIEESKDLSKLSLDELVGNLNDYEVVLEKDLESAKNKKEKKKPLSLKARQDLSDEDASSSDSDDEEYAMAVRDFKKFFRRRGKFVRQPYDDKKNFRKAKEDKKEDQRCFKCGNPNHFISDCPKNSFNDEKAFVVGCCSDSGDDKDENCLMAHENEVQQKVKLEPDEWIKASDCSRHMTGNKELFSTYKAIDGGNVLFGSNTKSKIISKEALPTTLTSQTFFLHLSPTSNNNNLLLTPKTTPPPLTSPPSAPTQPSKLSSPLAINLDPIKLLFSTPPTFSQAFIDSLKDLPPVTTNPPPHHPSFNTIERLANDPPPIDSSFPSPTPDMKPPIPPFPLQCSPNLPSNFPPLPPLGPKIPFPMLTHEIKSKDNLTRLHKISQDLEKQNSDSLTVGRFHWFWLPVPFSNGIGGTELQYLLQRRNYQAFIRDDQVPINLWIRNIVIRKHVEDLQVGIESYQTKLNLTQPDWDTSDFLLKEDYTIVSKPSAVIYKDINDQTKMMRETEVHKFSGGTLNRILDKLDHMVKDFKLYEYNSGMETRIWSEDDRRRSKNFMDVIERRLEIQRIFKSLESFVGGRLRDVDYRLIQRTE
uniref:Zf-CCHC domain-containing protein/UBN2 domain-containing protein n=1 Tax=Tanacetum cinerariifolium TaxID=118510 RepID=A0A699GYW5_TANCI|nr:zf-CCHC domain-containing protein/UBN2 domain-containing protein [Tanacetum cinerariifolium]